MTSNHKSTAPFATGQMTKMPWVSSECCNGAVASLHYQYPSPPPSNPECLLRGSGSPHHLIMLSHPCDHCLAGNENFSCGNDCRITSAWNQRDDHPLPLQVYSVLSNHLSSFLWLTCLDTLCVYKPPCASANHRHTHKVQGLASSLRSSAFSDALTAFVPHANQRRA